MDSSAVGCLRAVDSIFFIPPYSSEHYHKMLGRSVGQLLPSPMANTVADDCHFEVTHLVGIFFNDFKNLPFFFFVWFGVFFYESSCGMLQY